MGNQKIYVNGRYLTRCLSGVDRVAEELVYAWASGPENGNGSRLEILHPNAEAREAPVPMHKGKLKGLAWEHFELPVRSRSGWLLSFCSTGPLAHSKQVVIIHDAQPWRNPDAYSKAFRAWYNLLIPQLARLAKIVVTVSDFARQELEEFNVVPKGKAQVIHNGSDHIERIVPDPQVLSKHGLVGQGYFLAIGNLSPHKNLRMLIQAREAIGDDMPPLVIAGGGISRVFSHAGIKETRNVKLLGRVTDQELKALYQNAIAFMFPSLNEGFGIPPLEAMRCGCPVLATNAGAVPEVCGDAVISLDPYDPAAWSNAMVAVRAQDERDRLRAVGAETARKYTWDRAARQLQDLMLAAENN